MKKISFNDNWIFYKKGDAERQTLTLPHDAMIHEKREPDCKSGSAGAYFPGGIYCYEKKLEHAEELLNQHVEILFEGVYKDAKVYLNEELLVFHAYGYTPFSVVLDGKLKEDRENVLRVEADNSQMPNSRWYTGSGIYRPVWMYVSDQAHVLNNGIKIKTVSAEPPCIEVSVEHTGEKAFIEILDGDQVIKTAIGNHAVMELSDARLWSATEPNLYRCRVLVEKNGQITDEAEEVFGVRQISWDSNGLYVNGNSVLLRGACIHHDNGILGACSYEASEERKVKKLKEAGYNAIRSSHNPAAESMLRACDRLGMYVIDETWDVWYNKKSACDYSSVFMDYYKDDIRALAARDYNHPSVIMYSIGNEVSEPAEEKGVKLAGDMQEMLHQLDDTRPVTAGINLMILTRSAKGDAVYKEDGGVDESNSKKAQTMSSTMFNQMTAMIGTGMNMSANNEEADKITTPVLDLLDIAGYNYASGRYPLEGEAHPNRLIYGSETFPQDIARNWKMVREYPYLIGDFMWTAWDYLGEAGIGTWAYTEDGREFNKPYPWLLADTGAMDILGNPNGELFLAQAVWGTLTKPAIAVQPVNHPDEEPAKAVWRGTNAIPHWSWSGCEGNPAVVEIYGAGAEAELILNGKSLGRKDIEDYRAVFETEYHTGVLEAVLYDENGAETGRNMLTSAKEELEIGLREEKDTSFCGEPVYIELCIQDKNKHVECNQDQQVTVTVEGGKLLAFGSAAPRTEDVFDSGRYTTYYGKGQIVVMKEEPGVMKVTAESAELGKTVLEVPVQ